jgi:uncharacterized membrane protein
MMNTLEGKKIVYIGDWVFYTGPTFIESPFETMSKDCQLKFLGKPVTDAFEQLGATTTAYSNWQLYHFTPEEYQKIIDESDLIIVSDVEARCFHLSPAFFDQHAYGKGIVTFPDKLKILAKAVENGKGLIYMGGWLSFSGHMEKGGWRRCPIADWLPFSCLVGEDLMESSEGFQIKVEDKSHPILAGLEPQVPPLLGYNEFVAKDNFTTLWSIAGSGHPLLGVSEIMAGRMVTYGSDPVPHWGMNLMLWKDYGKLWQNMALWALKII